MQCACAILSSAACPALQYFSTLSHKRHDLWGKQLLNIKHVFDFSLQILSETSLILRSIRRDITMSVGRSSSKVPVIVVRFWWSPNIFHRFSKNTQMSNFIKIRLVGAELFHVDKFTDRYDAVNCGFFRNFVKAPTKQNTYVEASSIYSSGFVCDPVSATKSSVRFS
jgi:hypothetical protein